MTNHLNQICILNISDLDELKITAPAGGHFYDEIPWAGRGTRQKSEATGVKHEKLIADILSSPGADRLSLIQSYIATLLKETLGMKPEENVDPQQDWGELGVDSLMTIEIRNRLQAHLLGEERILSVLAMQGLRTLNSLSIHVEHLLGAENVGVEDANGGDNFENLKDLIILDSGLPADIQIDNSSSLPPTEFKTIFLTGATGHLGVHFLSELTIRELKVVCLVRAKDQTGAEAKLTGVIATYGLGHLVDMCRVQVLVGDVSKAKFGMDDDVHAQICEEVDAIIHCAASANHVSPYGGQLRNQHLASLHQILRFATNGKLKPIFHASSTAAVNRVEPNGILNEAFPEENNNGDGLLSGYAVAKFVAEKVLGEASRKGVPVTVMRYPNICGNSVTGYMPLKGNLLSSVFFDCARISLAPHMDEKNHLQLVMADEAVRISLKIFLSDTSEKGIYNLTKNDGLAGNDMVNIAKEAGFKHMQAVSFAEWKAAVFQDMGRTPLAPFKQLFDTHDPTSFFNGYSTALVNFNFRLSSKLLKNASGILEILEPTEKILRKEFTRLFREEKETFIT